MELISGYYETPLLPSIYLSNKCKVYLKLENTQPSGSFKSRGISALVEKKISKATKPNIHLFSSSGGNAGMAIAYAAQLYKVPCTVVVPKTTKQPTIERLEKVGAKIIVHGDHWAIANSYVVNELIPSVPDDVEAVYCHPFDDEEIWKGHSTMVDEIKKQLDPSGRGRVKPDAIILSVGGGGLFAGVQYGLDRNDWGDVPIITVETEGAATLYQSVKAGKQVVLDSINTIATTLGSTYIPKKVVEIALNHPTIPITVTDDSACLACEQFAQDHKFIVEPACGASLVPIYEDTLSDLIKITPDSIIVVILCGGTAASIDDLIKYRDRKRN